ncbi:hypothetical protein [Micromonospora sp. NPDC005189]|uniref:hypothetical protein n=1 Tax=unclassified Micromonospora TaxID=2617518 RepID=UPI00339E6489
MDQWLAVLDDLLVRPFPGGADVHHVDLRVSEDFEDCQTREEIYEPRCAEFKADRDRLAQAITILYGAPRPRDLMPYVFGNPRRDEPGSLLFDYLSGWFCEVDVWQVGDRGIIVEVRHYDKELPLQLMLVVGDIGDGRTTELQRDSDPNPRRSACQVRLRGVNLRVDLRQGGVLGDERCGWRPDLPKSASASRR